MQKSERNDLDNHCMQMRLNMLRLTYGLGRKGAHIAPSLSMTEILAVLFLDIMDTKKDIFVLSKGHGGLAYYTALAEAGIITEEQLDTFDTDGGEFPGQPSRNLKYGIVFSSGSLGMGLSYAAGRALGFKSRKEDAKVYCVVGDGESNEGSIWESAMFARQMKLDNLVVIVDWNRMQSDGATEDILDVDVEAMWRAVGWEVYSADGHDVEALKSAITTEHNGKPLVVLARSVKGKGVSFMENQKSWHHGSISQKQYEQAVEEVRNGIH